ncbi:MAG: tetratricopeptide repeat protein, partial [Alphaproteobacteria bacterium]
MRTHPDVRGLPLTAVGRSAVERYDAAVDAYLASAADTGPLVEAVILADPGMAMAHCLEGYLLTLAGQPGLVARARESLAAARRLAAGATPRERAHVDALAAWSAGDIRGTIDRLEAILLDHPRDILAFRLAHYLHFFIGDLLPMRDSAARVMPRWDEEVPGYGFLLGCRAFTLEETGDCAEAERLGLRAIELNPHDIWAGHAVAHVYETQCRPRDGIAWIDRHAPLWREHGGFHRHLLWHRCLYYLELERHDAALDQYDTLVWASPSDEPLDIANAASLLMRLELLGVDVGRRWETVGEAAVDRIGFHNRPFNDVHMILAMCYGRRRNSALGMLEEMRGFAATSPATIAPIMRDASIPLSEAVAAFAEGAYGRAVDLMLPIRYRWVAIGGSWAQRDLFQSMLIEAAVRAGRLALARALLAERLALMPASRPSWRRYAAVLEAVGDADAAASARAETARIADRAPGPPPHPAH